MFVKPSIYQRAWKRYSFELFFFIFILASGIFIGKAFAVEPKETKFLNQKPEQYIVARPATTTTTSTTQPHIHPKPQPVTPQVAQVQVAGDEIYQRLAQCESGDPTYNGPSGYDGAFQFSPATWNSMGTGYAFAYEAPFEVQLDAAKRLIARSGWSQFPSCARQLGML